MTIAISVGRWGGIYTQPGRKSWRLCLGFVAFTVIFQDLDYWLIDLIELAKLKRKTGNE